MAEGDAAVARTSGTDQDTEDEVVSSARLETLSDGVFAIAATLLVLDLKVPDAGNGNLLHQLFTGHSMVEYAAYAVSFMIIGVTWLNHHSIFRQVEYVDRTMTMINLLLLLVISFLPFPTEVLAKYISTGGSNAHAAAFFYSLVMAVMSVLWAALWWHCTRDGGARLTHPMTAEQVRKSRWNFSSSLLIYVPLLGVAFISAPLTLLLQAVLVAYYALDPLRQSH
jgi:uncharacterized membrane protein